MQEVRPRALDVLRWHPCQVDAAGCVSYDELLERAKGEIEAVPDLREGHLLALRLVFSGPAPSTGSCKQIGSAWIMTCALATEQVQRAFG
ncbi:MAG: hypothetical protein RQM92_12585 [Candidatus Syntrophopropionicum ammoniitolerans]